MKGTKSEVRPGVWRLRVYVGRDHNGSPIQKSRTFRGGSRKADDALRQFVTEVEKMDRGTRRSADQTVGSLLDRWLDHLDATPYTKRSYRYTIEASLKPALGGIRLHKLQSHEIDAAYRQWRTAGVTPVTIRKRHTILQAALHQAVKWDWLPSSPGDKATPPKGAGRKLSRVMSPEDVQRLVTACEEADPVLGTAVALAALTGARRGELCALRWMDIDVTMRLGEPDPRQYLVIRRSLTALDGKVTAGHTKTHQERRIALDPVAAEVIRRRTAFQEELARWAEVELDTDPWLLSRSADGSKPCLPNGLTHGFRRVADRLGMPWHFHELRHFAATTMLVGGVDARTAASRLGHSTPTLTLGTYAHVVASADENAARVIGRALDKGDNN